MSEDVERISLMAAEVEAATRLLQLHAKARSELSKKLDESLAKNIDGARKSVVGEVTGKLSRTFQRQLDLFVQVERELVLHLNGVLTSRYQAVLDRLRDHNTSLLHSLELISQRVSLESERASTSEALEKLVDVLLAALAILIPFYYRFLPVKKSSLLEYVVPTLYSVVVVLLVVAKAFFYFRRSSQASRLKEFVDAKFTSAKAMVDGAAEPSPRAAEKDIEVEVENSSSGAENAARTEPDDA